MKASNSLDGDNLAFSEKQGCPADRFDVVGDHCRAFMQRKRRTAAGASNWLRMDAAIGGVVIVTAAIAIHRPRTHGGIRPVVGQSEDDSVTRPAIDAADVGIAVSMIQWIKELSKALFTYWQVRRNANRWPVEDFAVANREFAQAPALRSLSLKF